jgi:hypothetical protein
MPSFFFTDLKIASVSGCNVLKSNKSAEIWILSKVSKPNAPLHQKQ